MKTLLVLLLLSGNAAIWAFDTCNSDKCEDSCKNRCGDKLDKSYSCQCNAHCERFGDCCADYSICSYIDPALNEVTHDHNSESSCQGRCGEKYNKKNVCHCTRKCTQHNNCCSDYKNLCGGGANKKKEKNHDTDPAVNEVNYDHKSESSCQGRCGEKYNKKNSCHCNKKCTKYNNCCSDYKNLCGGEANKKKGKDHDTDAAENEVTYDHKSGATISSDELKTLSEILYQSDVNKAVESDIKLNKQEKSENKRKQDLSEDPLYEYVNEDLFKKPTYKAFIALLDNYDRKTGTDETATKGELEEQKMFLQEIMKTKIMKELFKFFHNKGLYENEQQFVDDVQKMWFGLYSRSSGEKDSSGFEHVFVGEVKKGKVSGFHSWIRFYLLEKKGLVDYCSHNYDGPWTSYPDVLGKQFMWDGFNKQVGSQIIGSSPEFDFSLYTLCFVSRPGKTCTVSIGGHDMAIQTYEWTKNFYDNNKKYIATAYPIS